MVHSAWRRVYYSMALVFVVLSSSAEVAGQSPRRRLDTPQGGFPGSALLTPAEGKQINAWISAGNPDDAPEDPEWRPCYRKSVAGSSTGLYHGACDGMGPSVFVAELVTPDTGAVR